MIDLKTKHDILQNVLHRTQVHTRKSAEQQLRAQDNARAEACLDELEALS